MKSHNLLIKLLLALSISFLLQQKAITQHSEVGARVVLSGALMFGPYYTYWIDDHNALNASVLAAYENNLVFPFALNASYNVFFFSKKWRPELGVQYSYLIAPGKNKSVDDPKGISIISLIPGIQFRWDETRQNLQSTFWLAHFLDRQKQKETFKLSLIGLDFSYGFKFMPSVE